MSSELSEYINEIKQLVTKPINNIFIRLIKYNDNIIDIILHLDIESFPIKVTTDFNKYCIAESAVDVFNIQKFNIAIIFKNKSPQIILEEITKIISFDNPNINSTLQTNANKFNDPFHIYQKLDEYSKVVIDYIELEKEFSKNMAQSKQIQLNDKIPKNLLLSPSQIYQLIINEIKKVNRNRDYDHYILPDPTNPYNLLIRIKFNPQTELGKIFKQIEKDFGYDYMELKIIIDSKTHPFIPPKLEYIKPKIKLPLLLSIINLDILKLENWSSIITLEYFITNLATQLELIAKDYIIPDATTNGNSIISFNELEYELIKLASISKENTMDKVNIKIPVPKKSCSDIESNNKYWKAGTGYGHGYDTNKNNNWDIKMYIKEQEVQNEELCKILIKINNMITEDNMEMINNSVLIKYIINQIKGFSLLEHAKNEDLFKQIFNILSNLIDKQLPQDTINEIGIALQTTFTDLELLFESSSDTMNNENLLQMYCISDWYINNYNKQLKINNSIQINKSVEKVNEPVEKVNEPIPIQIDIKNSYCEIMKKFQFANFEISKSHQFYKYKEEKLNQGAIMRILSEISSFKKNLPLNWESSIWVRVPKNNFNLFSFMISGPKDTPYENGLFEFHAYFPKDYPNIVPQVLLNTTGGRSVRFNPNLYNTGKVCLSILGTWSGQAGEQWNSKTSTFLQVLVSIQSLILVEQPYFNEPGYQLKMNTPTGEQASTIYSEERMPSTIKFGMTDMIKNPPTGFEEIVHNHFKLKKDEIINSTLLWEQSAIRFQTQIKANRAELIELLEKL